MFGSRPQGSLSATGLGAGMVESPLERSLSRCKMCLPLSPPEGPPPLARSHTWSPPAHKPPVDAYVARRRETLQRQLSSSPASSPVQLKRSVSENGVVSVRRISSGASAHSLDSAVTPFAGTAPHDAGPPSPVPYADPPRDATPSSVDPETADAPASAPTADPGAADDRGALTALVGPVDFGFGQVTLEQYPELTVPRLNVRAVKMPIEDAGIETLFGVLDDVLARGQPLTILWDVRHASIPSRKQIGVALDWIGANSHLLDKHLQGVAIVLSNMIIRSIVNFVLHLTQPPQPNGCFADEPPAFAFARDQCTEVREWVGKKKLKAQREAARNGAPAPEADVAPPSTPTAAPAASRSATPRSIWGSRKKLPATAPAAARVPPAEGEREEQD